MTTPHLYTKSQIDSISNLKNKKVYHFCNIERLKYYCKHNHILSKGSLRLLEDESWSTLGIRKSATKDATNGFSDYIFFSDINWYDTKKQHCNYGSIGLELNLIDVIKDREFFVYPFNTGMYWKNKYVKNNLKFSDLTQLENFCSTAYGKIGCKELLVRRRVPLSQCSKVFCSLDNKEDVKHIIGENMQNLLEPVSNQPSDNQPKILFYQGYLSQLNCENDDIKCSLIEDGGKDIIIFTEDYNRPVDSLKMSENSNKLLNFLGEEVAEVIP